MTTPPDILFIESVGLPYEQPLNDGDGDTVFNDIILDVTENGLLLEVTEEQYVKLLSAALNGAITTYPQQWIEVIYPLIKAAKLSNDFCTRVGDCVDTNSYVQAIINQTIINQGIVDPNTIDSDNTTGVDRVPDYQTKEIAEAPDPCDLDALWSGIREIVQRIDEEGRDLLEDLQTTNDKIEQWSAIVDLVPLLGDTIKDVSQLFTQQIPDILNAYNAASNPTFLDLVACDIFAMVCNECRYPTLEELFEYFSDNSYAQFLSWDALTMGSAWDIIYAVTVGVPVETWYTINIWLVITLGFGGKWNGSYGLNTFNVWGSLGEDTPSDNWEVLCGGCAAPPFELYFDFETETAVPPIQKIVGKYQGGNYWRTDDLANDAWVWLRLFMESTTEWTEVEINYYRIGAPTATGSGLYTAGFPTVEPLVYGVNPVTLTINGSVTGQLNPKLRATNNQNTYPAADVYLFNMRVKGNGLVTSEFVPYMVSGTPA